MPLKASIYRILIASPSDVKDERVATRDIILEWNASHSDSTSVYLEPIMWETHVAPKLGDKPQNIINDQIINTIDIVIGIFWGRLGTPTEKENSGSVEEIKKVTERTSNAIVGFSQKPIPPYEIDNVQFEKLKLFRKECEENGIIFTFENQDEFRHRLSRHLTKTMARILNSEYNGVGNFKLKESISDSEYDPKVDHERLSLSAKLHFKQDRFAIEKAIKKINKMENFTVLDAGCGYGTVTSSRFGDSNKFEVLALDIDKNVIEIAKKDYASKNITYICEDINNIDKLDLGTFDIVFSSYLFHHIENQESVLAKLWDLVGKDGVLIVRSCDDGQHLHYPPDPDMNFLVKITDKISGSSDRNHGRRLYTQMKRLDPTPESVDLYMKNYSTANLAMKQRKNYWDVFHSNRFHYAKKLANSPNATDADIKLYLKIKNIMKRMEEKYLSNSHFLDIKSVPIVVGYKL